jgi:hypothetical protein
VETVGCLQLIRLSTEECEAFLASMPHSKELGLVAAPAAPEAAAGRAAEDLSSEQRCHLLSRVLAKEEDIEEDEGIGALTHRPQQGLRSLH